MLQAKRKSSGHRYKNCKNTVQCGTNLALDVGYQELCAMFLEFL
jgi:hypothetical protein